nr:probable protein phosphatase 2C 4 [Ipomoea batatas]
MEKAAAFESSPFFSSIPLQPIPRSSISSVRSGPVPGISRFKPKSKKSKLVRNFKKLMSNPLYKFGPRDSNPNGSHSNGLSSEGSLVYDEDEEGIEALMAQNVQWAQGKAGEDRLQNLYTNVFKELKGVLWNETKNTTVPLVINHSDVLKGPRLFERSLDNAKGVDLEGSLPAVEIINHATGSKLPFMYNFASQSIS